MIPQPSDDLLASFEQFASDVDFYYRDRFRWKMPCAHARFPTVCINRPRMDLYLRFLTRSFWPTDSIVIARIGFDKQRTGRGKELLSLLVMLSKKYGYTSIGIEQTNSGESIQYFVRKFGFKKHKNDQNWLVTVAELEEILSSLPAPAKRPPRRAALGVA